MDNISVESGSESASRFIGQLQESECYTNINFHEVLHKTHCLERLKKFEHFEGVLQVFEFKKKSKHWSIFENHAHVLDRCGKKNAIEKK